MDPVSVVGLSTIAFGMLTGLGKSLKFILDLSAKYRRVDAKVSLLIGYLSSIQASTSGIADIIKTLKGQPQQKIAESLETTLECTKVSLEFLDVRINALRTESVDGLSILNKVKVLFQEDEFQEYLSSLGGFVDAMNLQLNILQWFVAPVFLFSSNSDSRTFLEQQGILQSVEARTIIERMEDEASSLLSLRDDQSFMSKQTESTVVSEDVNLEFPFDSELLSSRIYQAAHRVYIRQATASGKASRGSAPPLTQAHDSKHFPRERDLSHRHIREDTRLSWTKDPKSDHIYPLPRGFSQGSQLKRKVVNFKSPSSVLVPSSSLPVKDTTKVLLSGISGSGKTTWNQSIWQFELGSLPWKERQRHTKQIKNIAPEALEAIFEAMERFKISWELKESEVQAREIKVLLQSKIGLPLRTALGASLLMLDKGFKQALELRDLYWLPDNAEYFLEKLPDTHEPDFIPSNEDMLRSYRETINMHNVTYREHGSDDVVQWTILDTSGRRSRWETLRSPFMKQDITAIIYNVNLGSLDETLDEDPTTNCLYESFTRFCSIVSAKEFANTKLVLCLAKKQKLAHKVKVQGSVPNLPLYSSGLWDSLEGSKHGLLASPEYPIHLEGVEDVERFIIRCFTAKVPESKQDDVLMMVLPDLPQLEDWQRIKHFVRLRASKVDS